jgi:hypothetical protein
MVTYRFLERKILKPQAEKLRAEGRAENQRLWTDWNRHRVEAEEKGKPFNEPPPGP